MSDNSSENLILLRFQIATGLKIFLIQCFLAIIIQNFIFTIKLEGLEPVIGTVPFNNLTLFVILFSLIFFPVFGSELSRQITQNSKELNSINKEKLFNENFVIGFFILPIGIVALSPIEFLYIISNYQGYVIILFNEFALIIHEITGILIKTMLVVVVMNLAPGIMIWIFYPYFYKFFRKIS